jgi:hypothetical protein
MIGEFCIGEWSYCDVPSSSARVIPLFTFSHEVSDSNSRTRKPIQEMSEYLNNLLRTGELRGTIRDPSLGYLPDATAGWDGTPPSTTKEALDRIATALAALGQAP